MVLSKNFVCANRHVNAHCTLHIPLIVCTHRLINAHIPYVQIALIKPCGLQDTILHHQILVINLNHVHCSASVNNSNHVNGNRGSYRE